MRSRLLLVLFLICPIFACAKELRWENHPEWAKDMAAVGLTGTMVIYDEQTDRWLALDRERAQTRFSPASTFKLFNALVALDTGAVKDEYEVVRWNGVKRRYDFWDRDPSLASGMAFSTVWFYQEMARRAGPQRMQQWLDRVGYGNRDIGGGIDRFWLIGGALRISPVEQIEFLRKLAHGDLPFSARAQEAVRRITIVDAAPDFTLHGKTGWGSRTGKTDDDTMGWLVGWVERAGRRWFYALNVDMPRGEADLAQRVPLARTLLVRAGALPAPKSLSLHSS
ncbi:MAG: class D beta-lactamase [Rhodanobacter sp.]|jgi:beta-lactamase class D|nr:class D beta-lactamase [Rhodanobacter sp.]